MEYELARSSFLEIAGSRFRDVKWWCLQEFATVEERRGTGEGQQPGRELCADRCSEDPVQVSFACRRGRGSPFEVNFAFAMVNKSGLDGYGPALFLPVLKPESSRVRQDRLWESTCFEFFLSMGPGSHNAHYLEINLSPEGDWNCYQFDSYRQGMAPYPEAKVEFQSCELELADARHFNLKVKPTAPGSEQGLGKVNFFYGVLRLGRGDVGGIPNWTHLSATTVLKFADGGIKYLAACHAGSKPDFHLPESFVIGLL